MSPTAKCRAWHRGTVTKAGREGGYDLRIHIQLDFKFLYRGKQHQIYQVYDHNQENLAGQDQVIEQGRKIAIMERSGRNRRQDAYRPHVDLSTYIFLEDEVA